MDLSALLDPEAIRAELHRRSVEEDRELSKRSFADFVKLAWPIIEPATPLVWGWHLDAVCEHVEALLRGQFPTRRLLIAVPPRTAKSSIASVMSVAWKWGPGGSPGYRALCSSYAGGLSTRDAVKCRQLVESPWYRERWPEVELTHDQNQKTYYTTTKGGMRSATSVGGTVTGEGGNIVICDDLLSVKHAESEAHRAEASDFFWTTLPTRLNDQRTGAMLVIAQRLHQADTIGEILDREPEEWEQLVLPMRFEPARRASTSLGWSDPRKEDGELLDPERFPESVVARLEKTLDYAAAGQLQQRPSPREGGIIKVAYLEHRYRTRGERPIRIIQSWDCASKAKERNDPSVCITAAQFADRLELWDVDVGRREFPQLLRRAKDLAAAYSPNTILIEDKDAGQQLIQQLRHATTLPVVACNPGGLDKVTRMAAETSYLEAGNLWLPESAPWVAAFVREATTFPAAAHDDQVDALSQLLAWMRTKAMTSMLIGPQGESKERCTP